jgi:hypothetical protein
MRKVALVIIFLTQMIIIWSCSDENSSNPGTDNNFRIINRIDSEYESGSWSENSNETYTYDSYGRLSEINGFDYSEGVMSKSSYSYPDNSSKLPSEYFIYSQVKKVWILNTRYELSYENGKISQIIVYDVSDSSAVKQQYGDLKVLYEYNNDLLTREIYYVNETGFWEQILNVYYSYENEKITEYRYEYSFNTWFFGSKQLFSYTNDKITEAIDYSWYDSWIAEEKVIFSYSGDKISQSVDYYYDEYSSQWTVSGRYDYIFASGYLTQLLYSVWNNTDYEWGNYIKVEYEYDDDLNFTQGTYSRYDEITDDFNLDAKRSLIYEDQNSNFIEIMKIMYPSRYYTGGYLNQINPNPDPTGDFLDDDKAIKRLISLTNPASSKEYKTIKARINKVHKL